jgi:hypothetical protein
LPPFLSLTYTGACHRQVLCGTHFVHVVGEQNLDKFPIQAIRLGNCRVKVDKSRTGERHERTS